jgi:deoxyribonuclease-4
MSAGFAASRRLILYLGAHMSIAGGVQRALERGLSIGCQAVQVFVKNQLRWSAPRLAEEEIQAFRELSPRLASVFAHTAYLINLASPDAQVFARSVAGLAEELRRCQALGIQLLVMHPGAHLGSGPEVGIQRLAQGVRQAYDQAETREVALLLETTARRGTLLGGRFEELRDILARLAGRHDVPAGICLDTCHVFSSGYELRSREGYERTMSSLRRAVGLSSLKALHLNDTEGRLGSGVDRHAHIGRGRIGLAGFRLLLGDRRLRHLPAVLETPKSEDLHEDVENLARLRRLARRISASRPGS